MRQRYRVSFRVVMVRFRLAVMAAMLCLALAATLRAVTPALSETAALQQSAPEVARTAPSRNDTIPGTVTSPYPTIRHLAVEWEIAGDGDLDGAVAVSYRKSGERRWREALPLRRVPAGQSRTTTPIFTWKNKHSGSIFDLQPNTAYEVRLRLTDPDGVEGTQRGGVPERMVRARTRPVPGGVGDAKPRVIELPAGEHGVLRPEASGTKERPLLYRSRDGRARYTQVDLREREWVYIEGVKVVNPTGRAVLLSGARNCAVMRCRIEALYGVVANPPGAQNCYIADNTIEGTTPWTSEAMGADGKNEGEGIQVSGPGNVICYNRVKGFRDAISFSEDMEDMEQVCIDVYNNDISVGADDAIEADFAMGNCRILRNRITNSFVGLSSQPGLGGPTYFIGNVMYNLTYVPFKFHRYSQGDVVLHNTAVKVGDGLACFSGAPFDHAYFRNNLCIGGKAEKLQWGNYSGGTGRAVNIATVGPHCSFDYDAAGSVGGEQGGSIGGMPFSQVEPHGILVDMTVFPQGVAFPDPPVPERAPADLRPRSGSAVVDAGLRLPNVNDGFRGKAPDIGAYEAGQALPHYGPRK